MAQANENVKGKARGFTIQKLVNNKWEYIIKNEKQLPNPMPKFNIESVYICDLNGEIHIWYGIKCKTVYTIKDLEKFALEYTTTHKYPKTEARNHIALANGSSFLDDVLKKSFNLPPIKLENEKTKSSFTIVSQGKEKNSKERGFTIQKLVNNKWQNVIKNEKQIPNPMPNFNIKSTYLCDFQGEIHIWVGRKSDSKSLTVEDLGVFALDYTNTNKYPKTQPRVHMSTENGQSMFDDVLKEYNLPPIVLENEKTKSSYSIASQKKGNNSKERGYTIQKLVLFKWENVIKNETQLPNPMPKFNIDSIYLCDLKGEIHIWHGKKSNTGFTPKDIENLVLEYTNTNKYPKTQPLVHMTSENGESKFDDVLKEYNLPPIILENEKTKSSYTITSQKKGKNSKERGYTIQKLVNKKWEDVIKNEIKLPNPMPKFNIDSIYLCDLKGEIHIWYGKKSNTGFTSKDLENLVLEYTNTNKYPKTQPRVHMSSENGQSMFDDVLKEYNLPPIILENEKTKSSYTIASQKKGKNSKERGYTIQKLVLFKWEDVIKNETQLPNPMPKFSIDSIYLCDLKGEIHIWYGKKSNTGLTPKDIENLVLEYTNTNKFPKTQPRLHFTKDNGQSDFDDVIKELFNLPPIVVSKK